MTIYLTDAIELNTAACTLDNASISMRSVSTDEVSEIAHNEMVLSRMWSERACRKVEGAIGLDTYDVERIPETPMLRHGDQVILVIDAIGEPTYKLMEVFDA